MPVLPCPWPNGALIRGNRFARGRSPPAGRPVATLVSMAIQIRRGHRLSPLAEEIPGRSEPCLKEQGKSEAKQPQRRYLYSLIQLGHANGTRNLRQPSRPRRLNSFSVNDSAWANTRLPGEMPD